MASKKKGHAGRLSRLTPTVHAAIIKTVGAGVPYSVAAKVAGITESCLYAWLNIGRKAARKKKPPANELPHLKLLEDIERTRAEAIVARVANIRRVAMGGQVIERTTTTRPDGTTVVKEKTTAPQWAADAWHLERQVPEEFSVYRGDIQQLLRELAAGRQSGVRPGSSSAGSEAHPATNPTDRNADD